jgi:signal transduction histidine kinase
VRGVGDGRRALAVARHRAGHEINNPLTVVGGNLQLLAEKVRDRPELVHYFERGQRAVRKIAEMISHMTRITQLEPLTGLDTGGVPTLDLAPLQRARAAGGPGRRQG